MRILVACEESQIVTKAFRNKGHEAYSCDIQESSGGHPEWHIQDDVLKVLKYNWDMIIAFPPCTDLSNIQSGPVMNKKIKEGKPQKALNFIKKIWNSCEVVCIENPISSYLNHNWIPYTQIIEPYYFGHNYHKKTCFWLKNIPPLISTIWNNPTHILVDSYNHKNKLNRKPPLFTNIKRKDRAKIRSKFHENVAEAMANQWTEEIIFNK